ERHVLAHGNLGDVPLPELDEAEEDLLDGQSEVGDVDALGAHEAGGEVADVIVIAGGDRQRHTHELSSPRRPPAARGAPGPARRAPSIVVSAQPCKAPPARRDRLPFTTPRTRRST